MPRRLCSGTVGHLLFPPSLSLPCWPFVLLAGCGPSVDRYLLIDASLRANDPKGADAIVQQAEKEYGEKSRVLYGMDRGMTLQLAGELSAKQRRVGTG